MRTRFPTDYIAVKIMYQYLDGKLATLFYELVINNV